MKAEQSSKLIKINIYITNGTVIVANNDDRF